MKPKTQASKRRIVIDLTGRQAKVLMLHLDATIGTGVSGKDSDFREFKAVVVKLDDALHGLNKPIPKRRTKLAKAIADMVFKERYGVIGQDVRGWKAYRDTQDRIEQLLERWKV